MHAHDPYVPPPPFDSLYPGKHEAFTLIRYQAMLEDVLRLSSKVTDIEYDHMVSQYDGGIAFIDFHLGKLIERLKSLGLYENSLIIITSDHGEVFGERGLLGHGVSVYEDLVYVPLIIKYPNLNEGRIVK